MLELRYRIDRAQDHYSLDLVLDGTVLFSFTCALPYDCLRERYRVLIHTLRTTTDDVSGQDTTNLVDFGRTGGVLYFSVVNPYGDRERMKLNVPDECMPSFFELLDALTDEKNYL